MWISFNSLSLWKTFTNMTLCSICCTFLGTATTPHYDAELQTVTIVWLLIGLWDILQFSGVGFLFRLYHLYIIYISVWAHFCFNHGIISYNRFISNMSLSQLMNVLCLPVVSALYARALILRHRGVQNPLVSDQGETVPFAEDCHACCLLRIICSV